MDRLGKIFWGCLIIVDILYITTWFIPTIKSHDIYIWVNLVFFFCAVMAGIVKFGFMPQFRRIQNTQEIRHILQRTDISDSEKLKMLEVCVQ